jgi:RimJ/RimL family protein N-acetyltransferase
MFARTDRLLLRPGWGEDAAALSSAIADAAIIARLPDMLWPSSVEAAEVWLAQERDPQALPELLVFSRTRGTPRLVGGIALRARGGEADLDYWIARPYWGLGFATEAGRAVMDIARNGLRLKSVASAHCRDNRASARVLEKLGFRPTGAIETRWHAVLRQGVECQVHQLAA